GAFLLEALRGDVEARRRRSGRRIFASFMPGALLVDPPLDGFLLGLGARHAFREHTGPREPAAIAAAFRRLGECGLPAAALAVHAAYHAIGERIRLAFGVGPEDVVRHLVVDGVDPAPLGVVLATALPVLRVHEMDLAVLVCAAAALPPI